MENNEKSLLDKVRIVLGMVKSEKLAEALLVDGTTMVQAESFDVGMVLNVVGEDGSMTPAPDGEHTLADGTVLVTVGGVITEVKEPEMEDETEEVVVTAEDMSKVFVEKHDFEAILSRVDAIEAALMETLDALTKKNEELSNKIQKLSEQPAANPIVQKRVPREEENALKGLLKNRKK